MNLRLISLVFLCKMLSLSSSIKVFIFLLQIIRTNKSRRRKFNLGLPGSWELRRQDKSHKARLGSILPLLGFISFYLTSSNSIYVTSFPNLDYHKNQFLKCMNMPYGESIETRLNKNKTKNP
jgi:hypothetical protein